MTRERDPRTARARSNILLSTRDFCGVIFHLTRTYFRPFLKLFELRHQRTVEDRAAAEKLKASAENKFDDYRKKLALEKQAAIKDMENVLDDARKQEAAILAQAREEAKKVTQDTLESVTQQRNALKKQLEGEVETLARTISERLLSRKA